MPSKTRDIPKESELHKKLVRMVASRLRLSQKGQQTKHAAWTMAENNILAYVPETDLDARRKNDRDTNGNPRYTTIKLPYTYALTMAAHTYLTSVFFGRSPVHQYTGRHGESEEQTQALEALIGYQVETGQMMAPYYLWFYDLFKYGVAIIEEYWDEEQLQFSQIEEVINPMTGKVEKTQVTVQMPGYKGSRICNVSPWDFFPDPRKPVSRYQEGEFCFSRKSISWNELVRRKAKGYYMNTEHVKGAPKDFAAGGSGGSQLETPESETLYSGDGEAIEEKHPATITVYEGTVEIIPKEWELGNSDYPEKWAFTILADLSLIIGCQPLGAMHCKHPFGVIECEVEAYGIYNRGLPEIIEPIQNTMDWLINQHFYNVRAALNNQFIIDPSKIVAKDAERAGPGWVWRLRPEAYGQDITKFFHQVQVNDVTRTHVGDIQTMFSFGERAFGINDQLLGMLAQGGRKTATEVRNATSFGVNRQKTVAEYVSATGFASHSQRLVQLSQQYYKANDKFKIAGSLVREMGPNAQANFLQVTPEQIAGFYDFVPVDGTLPVDRLALANLWKEILLQMRTVPGLVMRYDLSKIFGHVAQLAGIRNLNQFKIEIGSPESLIQQADAGNVVPIKGGRGGAGGGANPSQIPTAGEAPVI